MLKRSSSLYITLAVVILTTALLQVANNNLNGLLSYHSVDFLQNIYFEWLTPSLVHFNWMHWFLNIINLVVIVVLFYRVLSSQKLLTIFAISSAFIMINLYIFNPNVSSYVGMSGVLYTLAIYGALKNLQNDKVVSIIVLLYVVIKLFFGETINHLMGVDIALSDFRVIREVHWYGAGVGLLIYLFCKVKIFSIRKENINRHSPNFR